MTLDQLSAAATGARVLESRVNNRWQITLDFGSDKDAMRQFSDAYRTGQLVAVADDAVERVARAILKAHALDTTGFSHDAAEAIADHAVQSWMPEAKAAIAALAAKGTGDE